MYACFHVTYHLLQPDKKALMYTKAISINYFHGAMKIISIGVYPAPHICPVLFRTPAFDSNSLPCAKFQGELHILTAKFVCWILHPRPMRASQTLPQTKAVYITCISIPRIRLEWKRTPWTKIENTRKFHARCGVSTITVYKTQYTICQQPGCWYATSRQLTRQGHSVKPKTMDNHQRIELNDVMNLFLIHLQDTHWTRPNPHLLRNRSTLVSC